MLGITPLPRNTAIRCNTPPRTPRDTARGRIPPSLTPNPPRMSSPSHTPYNTSQGGRAGNKDSRTGQSVCHTRQTDARDTQSKLGLACNLLPTSDPSDASDRSTESDAWLYWKGCCWSGFRRTGRARGAFGFSCCGRDSFSTCTTD